MTNHIFRGSAGGRGRVSGRVGRVGGRASGRPETGVRGAEPPARAGGRGVNWCNIKSDTSILGSAGSK